MAVALDALPPHLSNRNHPNTRYVIFFGFEISGDDQFWEVIVPNIGGVNQQMVYGLNGNSVEIAVIGNNVEPFPPCSQEGIEKVAKALGQPPKLSLSFMLTMSFRVNHLACSANIYEGVATKSYLRRRHNTIMLYTSTMITPSLRTKRNGH
jgi:hypothetical protein